VSISKVSALSLQRRWRYQSRVLLINIFVIDGKSPVTTVTSFSHAYDL
jgi:hypothetical protein